MPTASVIRAQVEALLADRIPSALTPAPRIIRPVAATGIQSIDELLGGGLPLGALTEIAGPESSGRTSFALSFLAGMTQASKVCAWIDVSDALHPESAAAAGVDLFRLLWVRCGVPTRAQVAVRRRQGPVAKPWPRIEQALRAADLLLQGGGFSAMVLDMGSIAPEYASRVPLATWFRYRAAAEKAQTSILLLTQHSCAKSSAELLLRFQPGYVPRQEATIFAGIEHRVEVARRRFTQAPAKVIPLRKPPQRSSTASWHSRAPWAGRQ